MYLRGRACALHVKGPGFNPLYFHMLFLIQKVWNVAW